jgi:FAD/FMN-containing dehydrogenase
VVAPARATTVADAVAGVCVGTSSFRHGAVHETMLELEVLLPAGDRVLCTPDNEHADLFFGFANSRGTLGEVLRVRLAGRPAQPFLAVRHQVVREPARFFEAMQQACACEDDEFVDGTILGRDELVLSVGRFARQPARHARSEVLPVRDWLWRHDAETARVPHAADVPLSLAPVFLAFLEREIGILPVQACPVRAAPAGRHVPLYPVHIGEPYVHFGFSETAGAREPHPPGHLARLVEQELARLGGLEPLDGECRLKPDDFDAAYDMAAYARLKSKYDPHSRAPHLYDQCVRRAALSPGR